MIISIPTSQTARKSAFTLIELLTVIAVIAVLAGILIPVASKVRESGFKTKSASNLRQIGAAAGMWANDNGGQYLMNIGDEGTFHVALAPYLGYENIDNLTAYFNQKANNDEPPEGVWDNPSVDFAMDAGDYADYGMNLYVGGWSSRPKGHHLGGRFHPSTIPQPSKVIWMAETYNCQRDLRPDYESIIGWSASQEINVLYLDGRVEPVVVSEIREDLADGVGQARFNYPWGWPGHP